MIYQTSSTSSKNTEQIGERVGTKLRGGEVIALSSDLGGGKTTFVRGLARGMGSVDHVASPTFTIGRQYHAAESGLMLYHFDFYRLQEAGLIAHELAEALTDPLAVTVIEWGDIVEDVLPAERIVIKIAGSTENNTDARNVTFEYSPKLAYAVPEESTAQGKREA